MLGTQRAEVWSGVTIGGMESFETLQFWLATTFPGFCRLTADANQGSCLVDPATAAGEPTARFGRCHRVAARADAQWLGGLIDDL